MSCKACLRDIKIVGRGLCRACYQRWHKKGTTDYEPKRVRTFCQIDQCGKPVVSNGMCAMHRLRLNKHGDVHNAGPDWWGAKTKHPLYHSWAWLQRHKSVHPIATEWDDFLQFILDIGERPSKGHKLFSADESLPIGPDNFIWKRSIIERVDGESRKTTEARRQRAMRKLRPEAYQQYDLKRHYGLGRNEYSAMMEAQGGLCAICHSQETATTRGVPRRLAVDHCHSGGHVRALLCTGCNTGLGGFKDDPDLLRAAIAYLEKHLPPPA